MPTTRISAPTSAGTTKVAMPGVRRGKGVDDSVACTFNLARRGEGAAGSLERGTAGSDDKGTLRGEMATGGEGRGELACAGERWRDEPPPGATMDPTAAEKAAEGAEAATGSATPLSRAAICGAAQRSLGSRRSACRAMSRKGCGSELGTMGSAVTSKGSAGAACVSAWTRVTPRDQTSEEGVEGLAGEAAASGAS